MKKLHGRIAGWVTYREGDGVDMLIPVGPCEIVETSFNVTLTWSDGATHGATSIPHAEYQRYLESGVLLIEG